MVYIGIDPGSTGAVALIDLEKRIIGFHDTPTVVVKSGKKMRTQIDVHACVAILREASSGKESFVTIEKVAPMPNTRTEEGEPKQSMGVTSAFNFGMGYGIWQGICASLGIPYQLVHPATWKGKLMRDMGKEKDASRVKVMQLYPEASSSLTRKKDHNRADAALLAHYGMLNQAPIQPNASHGEPTLF